MLHAINEALNTVVWELALNYVMFNMELKFHDALICDIHLYLHIVVDYFLLKFDNELHQIIISARCITSDQLYQ